MPNVMAALSNIGGALCSTSQSRIQQFRMSIRPTEFGCLYRQLEAYCKIVILPRSVCVGLSPTSETAAARRIMPSRLLIANIWQIVSVFMSSRCMWRSVTRTFFVLACHRQQVKLVAQVKLQTRKLSVANRLRVKLTNIFRLPVGLAILLRRKEVY